MMQKVARGIAGTHSGDVTTAFLKIIRNLRLIKLRGHPEITEEQNHQPDHHQIPWLAVGEGIADAGQFDPDEIQKLAA